jgi:hypothetical protein
VPDNQEFKPEERTIMIHICRMGHATFETDDVDRLIAPIIRE